MVVVIWIVILAGTVYEFLRIVAVIFSPVHCVQLLEPCPVNYAVPERTFRQTSVNMNMIDTAFLQVIILALFLSLPSENPVKLAVKIH